MLALSPTASKAAREDPRGPWSDHWLRRAASDMAMPGPEREPGLRAGRSYNTSAWGMLTRRSLRAPASTREQLVRRATVASSSCTSKARKAPSSCCHCPRTNDRARNARAGGATKPERPCPVPRSTPRTGPRILGSVPGGHESLGAFAVTDSPAPSSCLRRIPSQEAAVQR